MKRALWAVPLLVVVCAWFARGAYSYYYTENGASPTWSNWIVETSGGGSLVSQWYSPGGFGGITSSDYNTWGRMTYPSTSASPGEISLTYRVGSMPTQGGVANVYVGASSDFSLSSPSSGSAYELSFGYTSSSSYYYLYKVVNGGSTWLSWGDAPAGHDNMTLRVVRHSNGLILAYLDNVRFLEYTDTSLTGGRMAVNVYRDDNTLSDTPLISSIALGALDSTPPNAIPSGSISASAFPTHVDLQWPAGSDDTNGTGVYNYEIYRNGGLLGSTTGTAFSDTTVAQLTNYTYTLRVVDFHGNGTSTNFNVRTPGQSTGPFPSATPEGRRVGVRATGAYWGASGENIDVMSGNLNYTLPLISAKARNGWGVTFNLTYNSQNWRYDPSLQIPNWNYGKDVGYGWGWRLMAGSITAVYSDPYTVSYYLFTDSTGAEYRLDQDSSNVWSSKESIYVYYDANASRLYFRDGSFWYFGCTSGASEADSGSMYPTLMEDANGNQIIVHYMTAPGAGWTDSSARISAIEDVRTPGTNAYTFNYNTDSPPHLTSMNVYVATGENYTFNYLTGQSLSSPFDSHSYGTTTMLQSVVVSANYTDHEFTYDGSGELTKVLLPYKGYLSYDYTTATYSSNHSFREVIRRYLSKDGIANTQYSFSHEATLGPSVHQYTVLDDPGGVGEKKWSFATSGLAMGLVTQYLGNQLPGPITKVQNDYTWNQDSVGNSYIGTALVTADPGQSYAAQKQTTQTVDTYGNVTQVSTYDYGNLTTPMRTDNYTYLGGSAYTSRYIFNRLASSPTATITYDQYSLTSLNGIYEWDSSMGSITARGNPTTVVSPSGTQTMHYNVAGGVTSATNNGLNTSVSTTSTTNYAAPSQITVGSLSTSMSYNSFLGLTNETDPNGAQVSIGYDAVARPNSTTSPFGATTTNTYSDTSSPPTATTTVNGRWTRTTMDGLGRTVKAETGYGSTTVSVAETVYDSCGCSPLGKMIQTALPHAPGANPAWTTYSYDGIGRTLTKTTAGTDTTSTTSYSYQGNTVTVTDAVGNWKKYTMDALGQLVQVNEPNPAGGSDYVTTYAYDTLGHLTSVSMPRPSGTQTRTFNYGNPPGAQLLSATNPENGTVTYTYNSDQTLATKTDAKNQQIQYGYDSYKRVTQIRRGNYNGIFTEDTCQQENYSYDTNPYDGTFSQYTVGRLAAVQYKGGYAPAYIGDPNYCNTTFTEMYSYSQAGGLVKKRLQITRPLNQYNNVSANLDATYTYDNEGRVTATQYPSTWNGSAWVTGPNLGNTFDSMGRLQKLTDLAAQADIISNATYNPAGQLLTTTGVNGAISETRAYNSVGQLTQLNECANAYCAPYANIQYNYSGTQNNGKITSETDLISGEQISYTYDSLNRLASATSSVTPGWGQSYTYDGFGNLTQQTVTKGTAPSLSVTYDPATNRQTGESADANGNICSGGNWPCTTNYTYDVENRISVVSNNQLYRAAYSYAPGNKRVWRGVWTDFYTQTVDEVTFWGANGQKLATYSLSIYASNQLVATSTGSNYYFGGKLIQNATGYVGQDRLGSIGKYFPYGQERPSATTDGKEKFATYFRDSETGLDYADQRYHQPGMGRFLTPDRMGGGPSNPSSFNKYAYVGGDPINLGDPNGTDWVNVGGDWCSTLNPNDLRCYNPFIGIEGGGSTEAPDISVLAGIWVTIANAGAMGSPSADCLASEFVAGGLAGCDSGVGEPQPPPQPSCDIEVYDRPIESLPGKLHIPGAKHGYIVFTDQYGDQFFFEGQKSGNLLTAVDTSSGGTKLKSDNPSKDHFDGSMSGADVCNWLSTLQGDARAVNGADIRYHWYGPNSTSVLTYMLNSLPDSSWANLPFMIGAGSSLPGL